MNTKHHKYPSYITDINTKYGCNISIVYEYNTYNDDSEKFFLSVCGLQTLCDASKCASLIMNTEIRDACDKFLSEFNIAKTTKFMIASCVNVVE